MLQLRWWARFALPTLRLLLRGCARETFYDPGRVGCERVCARWLYVRHGKFCGASNARLVCVTGPNARRKHKRLRDAAASPAADANAGRTAAAVRLHQAAA